jgi:hypothetical protein
VVAMAKVHADHCDRDISTRGTRDMLGRCGAGLCTVQASIAELVDGLD